jgi:glycosyltransferase involved in cell wall biosynthesis
MSKKTEIAFVIATKDRPEKLKKLLNSLVNQTLLPAEVIIVDGGKRAVKNLVQEYSNLNIKYLRILPPSATRQRNAGFKAVSKNIPFIGFLDDDTMLEEDAVEKIINFWVRVKEKENIGGVSLNNMNYPSLFARGLKETIWASRLNLYSSEKGKVMKSGFTTMIDPVTKLIYTDWLPTTASVWRREVLEKYRFDEWFEGYSYLEDLDFSYKVRKEWELVVVPDVKYNHYPAEGGRGNGFEFGKREVINRIYFVKKHKELSIIHCITAILIRVLISVVYIFKEKKPKYYIGRILGNIEGLIEAL